MRFYRFETAQPDCGKMMTRVALITNNTYLISMKPLSLLLLACLFFTGTYAQDTSKVYRPKTRLHQLWRNIIAGPQAIDPFRTRRDSLLRRQNLTPETHHPVAYIDGELGYAFLGVHGFENSLALITRAMPVCLL